MDKEPGGVLLGDNGMSSSKEDHAKLQTLNDTELDSSDLNLNIDNEEDVLDSPSTIPDSEDGRTGNATVPFSNSSTLGDKNISMFASFFFLLVNNSHMNIILTFTKVSVGNSIVKEFY